MSKTYMTSRERVCRALNFEQTDRIPIDFGGTIVTGIHIQTYANLRRRVGLAKGLPKIYDMCQMLAEIEKPIRQRFRSDVIGLQNLSLPINIPRKDWKPWKLFGEDILMPGGFNPAITNEGDFLLSCTGDKSLPPSFRLPKGGFYFDGIGKTDIMADLEKLELNKPKPEAYVANLKTFTDEELRIIEEQVEFLYKNTEYAIIAPFWEGDMWGPGGLLGWPVIMMKDKKYTREVLELKTEKIIKNLKLYTQALKDKCSVIIMQAWDYGTQNSELFSPELFAEMQVPYYQRINNWVHQNTKLKTFFHSDGSIFNILPMLIQAGVDIINPVQCSANNMEPNRLKEKFGKQIVFWGGAADNHVLQFGTPEEVKKQARERINILGKNGGYMFASIHNIQANVPIENVIAMYDTVFSK